MSGITKRLLEHWTNPEEFESRRFFFCQLEAIETLIWLTEAPAAEQVGIEIPSDGGEFHRLCAKMATGSGKTIVMAMVIAWHVLNKVTYPQDTRFSKNVLVVAPGLTVKSRLAVLIHHTWLTTTRISASFREALMENLRQGRGDRAQLARARTGRARKKSRRRRSVDKRGAKSDEAYVRDVLGDMASAQNILVINDEAHHAWRVPAEVKVKGI